MSEQIDTGDSVKHKPTGETWLVARVDEDKVYWCGYPFGGYGKLSDCDLVRKANREGRLKLLREIANSSGREGASIVRWAKQQVIHAEDSQDA